MTRTIFPHSSDAYQASTVNGHYQTQSPQAANLRAFMLSTDIRFIRGRRHLQGVPSSKTVPRTVLEFTPCEAPCGYAGRCPSPHQRRCLWTPLKGRSPFRIPDRTLPYFYKRKPADVCGLLLFLLRFAGQYHCHYKVVTLTVSGNAASEHFGELLRNSKAETGIALGA